MERKFSGHGMSLSVARETVTGRRRPVFEVDETDRGKRASTAEATALAQENDGPPSQVGKKKGGFQSKKRQDAEQLLPLLFDIALPDEDQPKSSLAFLHDQRTERKCRLPPVTRLLGVEKRRIEREAKQDERRKREENEKASRFSIVGQSLKKK